MMVRNVSVWFGMGHRAMQYINTLVLLHSLLCLWLNKERHEKEFYCCIDGRLPRVGISCATLWKLTLLILLQYQATEVKWHYAESPERPALYPGLESYVNCPLVCEGTYTGLYPA